ncbi:DoxX family protein [Odoribacter sp. OttesenSCG-928-J03]|nr:DoxX family protein [Odoribacter sp. OttesenSCG-928-J03]MDL2283361.1 DoxX family protein [Odoribacter sp. OttesenSCG-928-G04]
MKLLRNICRIIVGIVFIFSGFAKGIDPLGSMYKFIDYFNAFGMGWMSFSALFFAFVLSIVEFIVGFCLLLNIKTRLASWGALLFMAFFTPLTLVLAITNPVTDCGCFGDAWVLTNWETFWKNVVLIVMALVIFLQRNKFKSSFNFLEQTVLTIVTIVLMFGLETYCYKHLPIIDFRPYAIGKDIKEGMSIPEGVALDEYKITLNYKDKNTGKITEFDETNYPWEDTLNWEFHSSDQKLIKEGYKAPIHDFVVEHPVFGDITEEVLEDDNYTFLLVAYNLKQTSTKYWENVNDLVSYAQAQGYRFYGLTASGQEVITDFTQKNKVQFEFCATDEIQLKTIVRSNPGLVLLKKGVVINKWADKDLPKVEEIQNKDLLSYSLLEQQNMKDDYVVYILVLFYAMCLFAYTTRKYKHGSK